MDKIKDFVYEITDVLLAVFITIIIIFVIGWNLGDWFDFISIDNIFNSPSVDNMLPVESSSKVNADKNSSQAASIPDNKLEDTTTETATESNTTQISIIEIKSVVIPIGTPAVGIANILLEKSLIDSVPAFIELSENMNLSSKLKSGTFEISNDSSLEEIIKIIAKEN